MMTPHLIGDFTPESLVPNAAPHMWSALRQPSKASLVLLSAGRGLPFIGGGTCMLTGLLCNSECCKPPCGYERVALFEANASTADPFRFDLRCIC